MKWEIFHRTRYTYATPVRDSFNDVRLQPMPIPEQTVESFLLRVLPSSRLTHFKDFYSNWVHHFEIVEPHGYLLIEATSRVITHPPPPLPDASICSFVQMREAPNIERCFDYLRESRFVELSPEAWKLALDATVGLDDAWQAALAVNVTSAFMVTKRAIPHLKAGGHGSIINMVSLSTQTGGAGGAGPYAAAKGALLVFTRTLARELAPQVRTNTLCPGVIETRHHEIFSTPERMAQYRKETPLGRNGTADEVGQAALYLASDAAAFTNGAIIDVNGGRFLR